MSWRELQIPKWIKIQENHAANYAKFIAEPFNRGFGVTVGNALRRVLLSSLEGSAVTSIRIQGAQHEYSTIRGVVEDVTEIVLNIKGLHIKLHSEDPKKFSFSVRGKKEVLAKDLFKDKTVEVFNPDHHIMTINDGADVEMELVVDKGRGYVPAEENKRVGDPIGTIPVDSIFSPILKVNFMVEDARVGQTTDFDRLMLEIWTNGSISPQEALRAASNILIKHFEVFTQMEQPPEAAPPEESAEDREMIEKLSRNVNELELSVRAANCLEAAEIRTIADLVKQTEADMLKFHNFGKKSLNEIKDVLTAMGLTFGMDISNYESRLPK